MKIKRIVIHNFKRFKQLQVELSSFDCIVGANNSGKSTLLQSLALFDFVLHNCLSVKQVNGNNTQKVFEIKNRSIAPEEFVVLPVANAIDLWTDKIAQKGGKHVLIQIEVEFDNEKYVKASVDLNFNRYSISIETEVDQNWLKELVSYKISYLPVFSTFLTQEEKRTQAVIEDALSRGRVNSVIRNLLYDLKQKGEIHYLERVLQNAIPSFKELNIKFDEVTDKYIDVSYKEEGKNKSFDLFMAGSGFQQFVYLFGFIRLRNPNLILLDEPDVHLHGTMQASLISELKNLQRTEDKQIIFATHSRDIISRIEPDQIITLNEDKATRLKINFEIYDLLENLGSFDNIQIAQLQEFKRLLVVEDHDDWKFVQVFGKKILGEADWQKVEKRLSIFPAKGNPYKQDMVKLKEQLTAMFRLNSSGNPLKLFVLADWDYYPYRDELIKSLNQKDVNIKYHVWGKAEIENYLLVQDALIRLVKFKNETKNLFTDPFIDEFNSLLDKSKSIVLDKFAKAVEEYSHSERKGWNITKMNSEAQKLLDSMWDNNKLSITDAKEYILPGLKRWLQNNGFSQFSDLSLAESLEVSEIDNEVKEFIYKLADFAGVRVNKKIG
jgi:AAA15 family ATPase/GTPase